MKIIILLLSILSTAFSSVNGPCNGRTGICIDTGKCASYGGQTFSGKCPGDPNSVKCCDNISCKSDDNRSGTCKFTNECSGDKVGGKCPGSSDFKCCLDGEGGSGGSTEDLYFGPCKNGGGACINVNSVECETYIVSGKCSGGSNVKCCVSGSKPSWYIRQGDHTKIICYNSEGKGRSVKTSGCGIASLTMGIEVTTGNKLSPDSLFKEVYDNGYYPCGGGVSQEAISFAGKRHGVKVSWTDDADSAYSALESGKGVIFHVGKEEKYHFTEGGHYIFLKGAKTQNGLKKVYVFDPKGSNNYVNVLFALKKSDGGIEVAKRGYGADFGIISKS